MLKIKELPLLERPYEKLELYGAERLSNAELLAIIIKTGTKSETSVSIAQKILKLKDNNTKNELQNLQDISIQEFTEVNGIGKIKAIQLKAMCELAKRMSSLKVDRKTIIKSTQDVAKLLMEELRYEKREKVKAILLNSKNVLVKVVDISYGGTNFAVLEPKEIFVEIIKCQVPKFILVHNHPSGDPTPSKADYIVTDKLYDCADMLGIQMIDHVIIGNGRYCSVLIEKDSKQ